MTNRYERMKMQRRMQRRIRLVVEERRMALGSRTPVIDDETTIEIPPQALRAIGRVTVNPA
ncbi:hypothetical protein [Paractinoplanes rishiriensis]|uniref:Uncharacterized protein n=1 Tax=Paractinoplanes rishiriensis TaxID=1050105 RepID=A0A919K1M4_9ACTN|nr:hypothetical protein [Actinoplanes rishiriensis]GIE99000.1 hypothetical protein Ari01nite_64650 [Actinoplanes rishiriensis]